MIDRAFARVVVLCTVYLASMNIRLSQIDSFAPSDVPSMSSYGERYLRQNSNSTIPEAADGSIQYVINSIEPALWKNKHDLVHVITTDFQVQQPNLYHLGKARLEFLRKFAVPSMRAQSSQEFLWVIAISPELNGEIKAGILEQVHGMANVIVTTAAGESTFGDVATDETAVLYHGSIEQLRSYQEASLGNTLLETNLDPTGALHKNFVNSIQSQVMEDSLSTKDDSNSAERLYCVDSILEWQVGGGLKGTLSPRGIDQQCSSIGTTLVSNLGSGPSNTREATEIRSRRPCNDKLEISNECWTKIAMTGYDQMVLEGWMPFMGEPKVETSDSVKLQSVWNGLAGFDVSEEGVASMRAYLKSVLVDISQDVALASEHRLFSVNEMV